jgi:sulfoxide reductase catalytic subunit YedY
MANIIIRPDWHIPENRVTPEAVYVKRRAFLKQMGFTGAGLLAAPLAGLAQADAKKDAPAKSTKLYPAPRNKEFDPGWKLSEQQITATYNNFYEFSTQKDRVHELTGNFKILPWEIKIGGLVEKPMTIDVQDLIAKFDLEERVYRFRCVEAWAMIVPWTGFPLSKLVAMVQPKSGAKFVRFETFNRPDQAPGFARLKDYPWPYTEGLRLDEAMNPLTFVTTGIYGKPMPKQYGAPIRMVVPWKYGYKSIKSIVKIDFVDKQPNTLWESLSPDEYPFESNVNPAIPHPRWSQATERMIDTDERVRTQPYNGYADEVATLYKRG